MLFAMHTVSNCPIKLCTTTHYPHTLVRGTSDRCPRRVGPTIVHFAGGARAACGLENQARASGVAEVVTTKPAQTGEGSVD